MFAPVYTLLGWFEAMPLFFMLLGLDLLLTARRWGWIGSAVAAALGFLVKLTPILLVPIAVRWLGCRLSLDALRHEWFNPKSPGNLLRPILYSAIFAAIVVGVGYPLAHFNPQLALSSFRVNTLRPPWQSIWALLEGYYGYGLVPIDMRNLKGYVSGGQWATQLPWVWITLAFCLVYLWLYTRRYDWTKARTPIAFAAVSVIWLFLYSKGWSPQFVVWIVAFLVLLLPTLRGVLIAVVLTATNVVESHLFLILLPDEQWIMVGTVLVRTALLLVLAAEFLGQIWPRAATGRRIQRLAAIVGSAVMLVGLVGLLLGAPRAAQAYVERRMAEHPCQAAVELLRDQAGDPTMAVATTQLDVWRDLYPWLGSQYRMVVMDGYNPEDRPSDVVIGERMATLAGQGEFWWIERTASVPPTPWSPAASTFFARPDIHLVDDQILGACHLARVVQMAETATLARVDTAGGPIVLRDAGVGPAKVGRPLEVVLYWDAEAPVAASYTVFTQLFDPAGRMVAQQDNVPVQGLAPTDTWLPGVLMRDAYSLALPADAQPGTYQLYVGLYDANGRRTLTLPDGTRADHVTLPVEVQ